MTRVIPFIAILSVASFILLPRSSTTTVHASEVVAADAFKIDLAHSSLIYRVRHFGVSNFYGRVNKPKGRFRLDDADPGASYLEVRVELENMDAGNEGRNRFLLSPDFFNEREYPTAEFKSSSIRQVSEGNYEAVGTFTLHGVTKDITVALEGYTTRATDRFGFRAGFECRFTVKRSDYGMDLYVKEGTLGDEVLIIAAIEGVREQAARCMDDTTQQIVFGLATPAVLALAIMIPGRSASEDRARSAWRLVLALAVPVLVSFASLYGWPDEKWQRLLFVGGAALLVGVGVASLPRRWIVQIIGAFVVAGLCTLAIWPIIEREPPLAKFGPGVVIALLIIANERLAIRRPGVSFPVGVAFCGAATAGIVLGSGWLKLTIPVGATALALGLCGLVGIWRRPMSYAYGPMTAWLPFVGFSSFVAWLYTYGPIPLVAFALPICAPLLMWIAELPAVTKRPARVGAILRLVLVLGACAAAGVVAVMAEAPSDDDDLGDMYGLGAEVAPAGAVV